MLEFVICFAGIVAVLFIVENSITAGKLRENNQLLSKRLMVLAGLVSEIQYSSNAAMVKYVISGFDQAIQDVPAKSIEHAQLLNERIESLIDKAQHLLKEDK